MSNVEQREHDEQLAMENEIAILRGQVSTLTAAYENAVAQHNKTLDELRASTASAPKGFVLVPVVPTHAILDVMFNAGIDRHDGDLTLLYRAILAASPTPPSTEGCWLPIEAAPKDGSCILLVIDHGEWGEWGDKVWTGLWADGWMVSYGKAITEPTHWMPLPKAPTMQEDKP